ASRSVPSYTAQLGRAIKGLKIGVIHHFHETDNKVSEGTQRGITAAITTFRELGAEMREVQLSPLQDWHACSRLMLGAFVSGVDYVQAVRRRRELRAELQAAMKGLDIVLTATQPAEAAKIDAVPKWDLFGPPNFTMPFNVAGYPAISVCSGFGEGGLPVAIQLV